MITKQPPSLSNTPELVVRHLWQAILRGEIRSDEPLRQDKLANALGVSKVPVREALAQLKAEGLVTYKSNRGAFVTALSADEAREIYLMRIALETIAVQQAIPNLSKTDVFEIYYFEMVRLITFATPLMPINTSDSMQTFHTNTKIGGRR